MSGMWITYHDPFERDLAVNFELVGGRDPFTGVDQDVGEEEKHALLVALARQLVKATLSDKMLLRSREIGWLNIKEILCWRIMLKEWHIFYVLLIIILFED